jgi:hypothetical protein
MQLQLQPFMVFIRTPGKERSACALGRGKPKLARWCCDESMEI